MPPTFFFLAVTITLYTGASAINSTVELTTFNAASAAFLSLWRERLSALLTELPKSTASVLCLQEVWLETDLLAVVNATSDAFPYHVRLETHPSATPPCDAIALQTALACTQTRCPSEAGDSVSVGLLFCGMLEENCRSELRALGQRCMNCLVLGNPITGLFNDPLSCLGDTGVSYASTNGLLLLSKIPLRNAVADSFNIAAGEIQVVTRGYLSAEVENLGTVICSHFPTYHGTPEDPYIGPVEFESVEEEQNAYFQQLMNRYSSKSPLFLIGDYNHGPSIGDAIAAAYPRVYEEVLARGFISPAVTKVGLCTFCSENVIISSDYIPGTLVNRSTNATGVLIDHIYIPSQLSSNVMGARRIYDSVLPLGVPLSDHYGMSVTYQIRETAAEDPTETFEEWKNAFNEWKNKKEC
ncbi:uncharacterized protein [Oscarella lobularis]|uniref:uncharacterized protein n=1 Tax=Oscarella lobularis TaxID=121494 RepID=UPI00331419FB